MQHKKKAYITAIMTFLTLSIILASMPMASAQTAAITCDPTSANPGDSVTVDGTDFGASCAVGIGFGAEVAVTGEIVNRTGSDVGPYNSTLAYRPIKPGTLNVTLLVAGGFVTIGITDDGAGGLTSTSQYFASGTVNYATGTYICMYTTAPGEYTVEMFADYTCYEEDVTPAAGVTSDPSGVVSASITVPTVDVGNYDVTAVDTEGNIATTTTQFEVVPEGLTFAVMVLLSSVSVLVGSHYLWKSSRKREK